MPILTKTVYQKLNSDKNKNKAGEHSSLIIITLKSDSSKTHQYQIEGQTRFYSEHLLDTITYPTRETALI